MYSSFGINAANIIYSGSNCNLFQCSSTTQCTRPNSRAVHRCCKYIFTNMGRCAESACRSRAHFVIVVCYAAKPDNTHVSGCAYESMMRIDSRMRRNSYTRLNNRMRCPYIFVIVVGARDHFIIRFFPSSPIGSSILPICLPTNWCIRSASFFYKCTCGMTMLVWHKPHGCAQSGTSCECVRVFVHVIREACKSIICSALSISFGMLRDAGSGLSSACVCESCGVMHAVIRFVGASDHKIVCAAKTLATQFYRILRKCNACGFVGSAHVEHIDSKRTMMLST